MVETVSLNSDWHIYILTSNLFQKKILLICVAHPISFCWSYFNSNIFLVCTYLPLVSGIDIHQRLPAISDTYSSD